MSKEMGAGGRLDIFLDSALLPCIKALKLGQNGFERPRLSGSDLRQLAVEMVALAAIF